MHNPAADLKALFDTWTSRSGTASAQIKADSPKGWEEVSRGFHLLEEIEFSLLDMKLRGRDVQVFLEALNGWRASLLNYNRSWQSHAIDLRDPQLLSALVPLMHSDPVALLNDFNENDLRSRLESFAKSLIDDETIDAALRQYVLKLVAHIKYLLDLDRAGTDVELSTCLAHLKFCFDAAAQQTETDERGDDYRSAAKWIRDSILAPVAAGVALTLTLGTIPGIEG